MVNLVIYKYFAKFSPIWGAGSLSDREKQGFLRIVP